MRRILLHLFILLILLNIQSVFGKSLTVDISKETKRELIDKLKLRKIPNNASQYVLNRIDIGTLINNDFMTGGAATLSLNDLLAGSNVTLSSVNKQLLTLVFEEYESSDQGGVIHWLGYVQGDSNSFARLTIDIESVFKQASDGPVFSQVAGTILTKGKTIKLRSTGEEDYHILYEVKDNDNKYLLQLNNESKKEKKARWVAAKGIQRDLLDEMPEASFMIGNRGSMTGLRNFTQGEIGELEVKSENDLERVVDVLTPYFPLIGSEEFTFYNRSLSADGYIYRLAESINGIHIDESSLRIFVSKANHKITNILSTIIIDKGFTTKSLILEDEAKNLALDYMVEQYGGSYSQFEAFEAKLIYDRTNPWERDALRLHWAIEIYTDDVPVYVLVDTDNGNVVIWETVVELQTVARVCDAGGMAAFLCNSNTHFMH